MSRLILVGEPCLRRVLAEYVAHYHEERPHQGKGNVVLMPAAYGSQREAVALEEAIVVATVGLHISRSFSV